MLLITLYLTTLFIAPQLWIEPFVDLPTDYIVYPVWLMVAFAMQKNENYRWTAMDNFVLAFVVWLVLSALINDANARTQEIIISYAKWLILYKLVSATLVTMDHVRKAAGLLVFFALVLAVEGIQHKLSPDGIGWAGQTLGWIDPEVLAAGGTGRTRWINIFDGPGVFCVIYTIAFPFLLRLLDPEHTSRQRAFAWLAIPAILLAIFYTGSRGGFLTTLGILALYMALRMRISFSRIALIGGLLFTVFMLAPAHLTTMEDSSRSGQHRVEMWAQGVEMAQQNPVFGIGRGNFADYTGSLIAHNSAVEIMGEAGMFGLFLWFGVLYLAFKTLIVSAEATVDPLRTSLIRAIGLSIAGYVISAMFVTLEYETQYFLYGLAAATGYQMKQPVEFTHQDFVRLSLMTVGFFILMKAFAMLYFKG